jgi:hypothetical protein
LERSQDIRKKYPLLVVGNQPFPGLEGELHAALPGNAWQSKFICFTGTPENLRERLAEAGELQVPAEQILLCARDVPLPFPPPAGAQIFEYHPEESPDDLRHRLAQKLDLLRQLKLPGELARFDKQGIFSSLAPAQLVAALDYARFAHALAIVYGLSPERHALAIRLAASAGQPAVHARLFPAGEFPAVAAVPPAVWDAALPPESLLALGAALAASHGATPATFREQFRECSARLPFRVRNELKAHLEKILEPLWGGKHAA